MNLRKLVAAFAATAAALTACGGGGSSGGIGGTGSNPDVAYGGISNFGSVWVNGVEYQIGADTRIRIDGQLVAESDLRIGMVVRVDGSISGKRAGEITVDGAVKGWVEQVIDANQIVVMGQTIQIDTTTRFDNNVRPAAGERVDVHGLVAGDGVIAAGYIERKNTAPTPPFAVKGVVKNQNTAAQTFQVGSLTVVYAAATIADMPAGSWNGLQVEVKGNAGACAGIPVCGTLTASQVEPNGVDITGAEKAEIEGVVASPTAGGFTLGGMQVSTGASTRYEGGLATDLLAGTKVEVEGTVSGSTLVATKVSFRDAIRIEGDIASVSSNTLTITGLDRHQRQPDLDHRAEGSARHRRPGRGQPPAAARQAEQRQQHGGLAARAALDHAGPRRRTAGAGQRGGGQHQRHAAGGHGAGHRHRDLPGQQRGGDHAGAVLRRREGRHADQGQGAAGGQRADLARAAAGELSRRRSGSLERWVQSGPSW
ncbi:MAG: DUF5666 domain-containing protein [Piscinibacter sp.]